MLQGILVVAPVIAPVVAPVGAGFVGEGQGVARVLEQGSPAELGQNFPPIFRPDGSLVQSFFLAKKDKRGLARLNWIRLASV